MSDPEPVKCIVCGSLSLVDERMVVRAKHGGPETILGVRCQQCQSIVPKGLYINRELDGGDD